jgi:hypothetical protein
MTMKIVSVVIGKPQYSLFADMPYVTATFESGWTEELFFYDPDEISFEAREFVGRTVHEAIILKLNREVNYLRSSTCS